MNTDDRANELSWLKGGSKKSENSPLRPQDREEDAPSWLYEDTVPEQKESKASKVATDNKVTRGGVKWKQPMASKPTAMSGEDSEDEGESCCCCCPSDPMLFSFQCFHLTAGLSGIGAFAANIYVFTRPHVTVKEAIIRSYALIFCLLMVATELDWRYVVNKVRFMDWWVLRGFFYTFIGFITFGLADSEPVPLDTPEDIVGLIVFFIGVCYIVMGTLCMKSMKQRRMINLLQHAYHQPPSDDASYA